MDPFALPCHPEIAVTAADRDWRAIGVRSDDDVLRKATRCPVCTTAWTAFARTFPSGTTVEWVRPVPFRVVAAPLEGAPRWQDDDEQSGSGGELPTGTARSQALADLQDATSGLGPAWERSAQLCTPAYVLTAGGEVVAQPGDLLLERREKWNAQDRRLALLWSPRTGGPVVCWHGFARLRVEVSGPAARAPGGQLLPGSTKGTVS